MMDLPDQRQAHRLKVRPKGTALPDAEGHWLKSNDKKRQTHAARQSGWVPAGSAAGMLREQLLAPTPVDLRAFLMRALRPRDCLVQVGGLAEVSYHRRAASTAEVGPYLVMIKRDGSLQIHAPKGVKPMNWQPKTDEITAVLEEEQCVLLASRRSPMELVRVTFLEVQMAQALELNEEAGWA